LKKSEEDHPETPLSQGNENCANPWNGECRSTDIVLYILFEGDNLPICRDCWNEIAETDIEWGDKHAFQ
jgi:hypothetical protein